MQVGMEAAAGLAQRGAARRHYGSPYKGLKKETDLDYVRPYIEKEERYRSSDGGAHYTVVKLRVLASSV
jgi:hypothetical protein